MIESQSDTAWFPELESSVGIVNGLNKTTVKTIAAASLALVTSTVTVTASPSREYWNSITQKDSASSFSVIGIADLYETGTSVPVISPRFQIERIRKVFSPAISDLAMVFGVSRQTIYNWLNDRPVDPGYHEKLEDLAQAAELIANAGISVTGWLLKRKYNEGKSFLELVRDGSSAQQAVLQLIAIVQSEAEQSKKMDIRFAGRKKPSHSPEFEFPAANDIGE